METFGNDPDYTAKPYNAVTNAPCFKLQCYFVTVYTITQLGEGSQKNVTGKKHSLINRQR